MFEEKKLRDLIMAKKADEVKKQNEAVAQRRKKYQKDVEAIDKLIDELRYLWFDFTKKYQQDLTAAFEVSKCLSDNLELEHKYTEQFKEEGVKGLKKNFEMRMYTYRKDKFTPNCFSCVNSELRDMLFKTFNNPTLGKRCRLPGNDFFVVEDAINRMCRNNHYGSYFMFSPTDTEHNLYIGKYLYPLEEYLKRMKETEYPKETHEELSHTVLMMKALFITTKNYMKDLQRFVEERCKDEETLKKEQEEREKENQKLLLEEKRQEAKELEEELKKKQAEIDQLTKAK